MLRATVYVVHEPDPEDNVDIDKHVVAYQVLDVASFKAQAQREFGANGRVEFGPIGEPWNKL